MAEKPFTNTDKLIVSVMAGLLFLLISSPFFYFITNSIISVFGLSSSMNGYPSIFGLILHTIIFIGIIYILLQ